MQQRGAEVQFDAVLLSALTGRTTVEQAMNIPAFAASVDWIANKIAALPIKLYSEDGEETSEITDDIRLKCLNDESYNDTMTAHEMKYGMVRDYLLYGRGYAYIDWSNNNTVAGLHYVRATDISYNLPVDPINRSVTYWINGKQYSQYQLLRLLRHTADGVSGKSIIDENPEMLSIAYATMIFEKQLVKTGGCRKSVFQSEKVLSDPAFEAYKKAIAKWYEHGGNAFVALNAGTTMKEMSASPVELQMNENKLANSAQIYELFCLSADIIRGTATDEQISHGVQNAIVQVITALEAILNRNLLLEVEKGKKYFAVDLKELLKGDIEKRYRAYQIALQSNFMQLDEVRYAEDLKPLGLDFLKFGLSDVFYNTKTKQFYTPNTDKQTKPGEKPAEPAEDKPT